jgi:TldD protein
MDTVDAGDLRTLLEATVRRAQAAGAEFADVRVVGLEGTSVGVTDGVAKDLFASRSYGAAVRVLRQGYWGFAPTSLVSPAGLEEALAGALACAGAQTGPEKNRVAPPAPELQGERRGATEVQVDPRGVSETEKMERIRALEGDAREYGPQIKTTSAYYADGTMRETVANSYGTFADQTIVRTQAGVYVVAREGDNRRTAHRSIAEEAGYEVIRDADTGRFGVEAAEVAVRQLGAAPAPAGRFPVVMDPGITGLFAHEAVGHNAEGDGVALRTSILEGRLGQAVGSPAVTMIDDATLPRSTGSYFFDSEGTPAARRTIIDRGVLAGYLHSLESAARLEARPNGSARGYLHQNPPIVRMSNTFFAPGEATLESLLDGIDYGLLCRGANWGYVFVERGQFTCNVEEATAIRKGQLAEPVSNVSIGGITLDVLQGIEACSRDFELKLTGGMCGKGGQPMWVNAGGPYVRVREVVVGGYRQ